MTAAEWERSAEDIVWAAPQTEEPRILTWLAAARERVVEQLRREAAGLLRAEQQEEDVRADIASGKEPEEAYKLTPPLLKDRMQPLRSLETKCTGRVSDVYAFGVERSASYYLLICSGGGLLDNDYVWLQADNSGKLLELSSGNENFFEPMKLLVRGEPALLKFVSPGRGSVLKPSGVAEEIALPNWAASAAAPAVRGVSASGQWIAIQSENELMVGDYSSATARWRKTLPQNNHRDSTEVAERFGFILEAQEGPKVVLLRHFQCVKGECSQAELVLIDTASGAERSIPLPAGNPILAAPYGEGAAIIKFSRKIGSYFWRAVVELDTGNVSWFAPEAENPPLPRWQAQCLTYDFYETPQRIGRKELIFLAGEAAELAKPERSRHAPKCAVSMRGEQILIVAPPFAHLYGVD